MRRKLFKVVTRAGKMRGAWEEELRVGLSWVVLNSWLSCVQLWVELSSIVSWVDGMISADLSRVQLCSVEFSCGLSWVQLGIEVKVDLSWVEWGVEFSWVEFSVGLGCDLRWVELSRELIRVEVSWAAGWVQFSCELSWVQLRVELMGWAQLSWVGSRMLAELSWLSWLQFWVELSRIVSWVNGMSSAELKWNDSAVELSPELCRLVILNWAVRWVAWQI